MVIGLRDPFMIRKGVGHSKPSTLGMVTYLFQYWALNDHVCENDDLLELIIVFSFDWVKKQKKKTWSFVYHLPY